MTTFFFFFFLFLPRLLPGVRVYLYVSMCAFGHSIPVTVFSKCFSTSDRTLGAAACPSQKSAISVRCHTKVLADGKG